LPDFVGTVSLNFCDIDIVQPLEIGNCYHNPNAVNALTALTDPLKTRRVSVLFQVCLLVPDTGKSVPDLRCVAGMTNLCVALP